MRSVYRLYKRTQMQGLLAFRKCFLTARALPFGPFPDAHHRLLWTAIFKALHAPLVSALLAWYGITATIPRQTRRLRTHRGLVADVHATHDESPLGLHGKGSWGDGRVLGKRHERGGGLRMPSPARPSLIRSSRSSSSSSASPRRTPPVMTSSRWQSIYSGP